MIVEFIGPAGSGKTTYAHALCNRLREQGCPARVVLSDQPIRPPSKLDPGGVIPAASRLAGAITTPLAMACQPFANAVNFRICARLVRTLPPRRTIWLIRLSQSVLRLARAWHLALGHNEIMIFDQAFLQAVSSLALFNGKADEMAIANALDIIPYPDLVVRISASQRLLETRLADRMRRQSFTERLFEASLKTNLQSASMVERVCSLLEARGQPVLHVDSSHDGLTNLVAMEGIEEEILIRFGVGQNQPAI